MTPLAVDAQTVERDALDQRSATVTDRRNDAAGGNRQSESQSRPAHAQRTASYGDPVVKAQSVTRPVVRKARVEITLQEVSAHEQIALPSVEGSTDRGAIPPASPSEAEVSAEVRLTGQATSAVVVPGPRQWAGSVPAGDVSIGDNVFQADHTGTTDRVTWATDERGLRWRHAVLPTGRSSAVRATAYSSDGQGRHAERSGPELVPPGTPVDVDPFTDPFGDRQAPPARLQPPVATQLPQADSLPHTTTPSATPVPATGAVPAKKSVLSADSSMTTEPDMFSSSPLSTDTEQADHLLRLEPRGAQPSRPISAFGDDALEEPSSAHGNFPSPVPGQVGPPKEAPRHIFNQRDCDQDQRDCQEQRERVRARSIQQISLDISPSFNPVTLESGEPPAERSRQFENEYRTWRDPQGNVLAVGALQSIEHGRLLIRTREGQLVRLPYRQLSQTDQCYFTAWWGLPTECTLGYDLYQARQPIPATFTWKASALHHKPLYFEEVMLERYGQTAGPIVQPVLSGVHFVGSLVTLPYQMGIHPPHECRYPLGYYRPGNCAPWLVPPVPVSIRGGLAEAGAILGGVFVIP